MSEKMRPYTKKIGTVASPVGKKFIIRPGGSSKCIEGVCMEVVKNRNQKHFLLKDGKKIRSIGEGSQVVKMSI